MGDIDWTAAGFGGVLFLALAGILRVLVKGLIDRWRSPGAVRLEAAQAREIEQSIYKRLLDETQEDRARLRAEVETLDAALDAERKKRRELGDRLALMEKELEQAKGAEAHLRERVTDLEKKLAIAHTRELKLLGEIAAQQRRIESQAAEIIELRQKQG